MFLKFGVGERAGALGYTSLMLRGELERKADRCAMYVM